MKAIGEISSKVLTSASELSRPGSKRAAWVSYDGRNLPAALNHEADFDIPNRIWSAWIPSLGARSVSRALLPAERLKVQARVDELEPALQPYRRPEEDDRVAEAISKMFNGFPSMRERGQNAIGRIDTAMDTLREFPAWAIEEACRSVRERGYLVEDSRGGSRLERYWPPSDPVIAGIVDKAILGRKTALANAVLLLDAPVEPAPVPATERKFVSPAVGTKVDPDAAAMIEVRESKQRKEILQRFQKQSAADRIADYRRAGLEPPLDRNGNVRYTLALALSLGWAIEDGPEGSKILVRPAVTAPTSPRVTEGT